MMGEKKAAMIGDERRALARDKRDKCEIRPEKKHNALSLHTNLVGID
jgi:hypothetical protein